jgi:hypothetical protein
MSNEERKNEEKIENIDSEKANIENKEVNGLVDTDNNNLITNINNEKDINNINNENIFKNIILNKEDYDWGSQILSQV